MTSEEILKVLTTISKQSNGLITTKEAGVNGVSRAMLSKLCNLGKISRISAGQYVFATELGDELFSLSKRSSLFIFSHETALFLNGISERTPFAHTVTIPSSKKLGVSISEQCKVYYVKDELFNIGKTILKTTQGNPVPAYDMERTVCDIIRSRKRIADETVLSTLKRYSASPKKNLIRLNIYAETFGMTEAVRRYLEVLL